MPQMHSMNWLILMIYFLLVIYMFMVMLYFSNFKLKMNDNNKLINFEKKFYLKWY